ncbi:LysM peptidoglycan-binding domain-containing protein [Nocardioides sp. NPDC057772]|uniref:LysM peptidoglycan-binding domain-containing protein n=1 Tax=Nocardioides sp. NPDC057772 TaxID=3346245 RepID=UPI00366E7997
MITRLRGLAAILALTIFVIGVPLVLLYTRSFPDFSVFTWERLKARDDGTLALAVIYVACWVCWAIFSASVVVSVVSMLRGISVPHMPGLAIPQGAANHLVASAALLFVSVPAVTQTLTAPPADAISAPDAPVQLVDESSAEDPSNTPRVEPNRQPEPAATASSETVAYTVKRGDSLWRIAEKHLGSGTRFKEIVALNTYVLANNPDYLEAGLILRLPAPPDPASAIGDDNTYVVEPGDTLSEIAEDKFGDAARYPQIFNASTNTIQPDGTRLTDPDLIRPGWTLQIPETTKHQVSEGVSPTSPPPPPPHATPSGPRSPIPETSPSTSAQAVPEEQTAKTANDASDDEHDGVAATPAWVLPGLTGSGAVLAGLVFLAVRTYRRTTLRYRQPGHILASPPEITNVAKTAQFAGSITGPNILGLNHLLEALQETATPMPLLRWVALGQRTATLHLVEDAELPQPWTGSGTVWTAPLPKDAPDPEYTCAYPLLIGIGSTDSGEHVLINLEEDPYVTVSGDPDRCAAFARYVSAELAFNPWSINVIVDTFGEPSHVTFRSSDLSAWTTGRANHHYSRDDHFVTDIASSLDPKIAHWEIEDFHAVIATSEHAGLAQQISEIVAAYPARAGTAVLITNARSPEGTPIELTHEGRLHLPALGLDLAAAGITESEAATCAAVASLAPDPENIPVPTSTRASGQEGTTDEAGALLPAQTEPRPAGRPAGPGSVLPKETKQYVAAAATTASDIEHLAPVAAQPPPTAPPASESERPEDAGPGDGAPPSSEGKGTTDPDASLNSIVDNWYDPDCPYPRLSLLGPVSARTHGDPKAVARRKPFYLEILAYLVLHPEGVTGARMSEDFGIRIERLRTDIGEVRKWLGTNPRTGKLHLPKADTSDTSGVRGSALYRVEDVLTDWDLFRRLRTRGQRRGADGIDDLIAALDLVTGEPFSHIRPAGWAWLNDLRTNDIAQCAIVDTAHIVTAHALEQHDTNLALVTVEIATKASPYDEICRLDLARVKDATGDAKAAEEIVRQEVFNRTDDHQGPIEESARTRAVAAEAGWIRRDSQPSS